MNKIIIDIKEIMELIPHRYPFLLIDSIIELNLNHSIIGIKNVTFNEPQFQGHFPGNPVMPGVLTIEAMAQVSAILISKSLASKKDKEVLFKSIEQAKFRKVIIPGDVMVIHSNIEQSRASVWKFSSKVEVNDKVVAESMFTAMVKDR